MIILHQPDSAPLAENPAAMPRDDGGGPIFAEPWQAEAFALRTPHGKPVELAGDSAS
jgi:hypothetical protein